MGSFKDDQRTYPLRKPPGHKPPMPRWSLQLPKSATHLYTIYIGVQKHSGDGHAAETLGQKIESILTSSNPVIDRFRVSHGFDVVDSRVWVAYWSKMQDYESTRTDLNLIELWKDLEEAKNEVGVWCENFAAPVDRLETNYSRLDHKPGLAQLPDSFQSEHEVTGYWGAGRDRIPASAHNRFETPEHIPRPAVIPQGLGERLTGTNYDHMCHIRSGQWWERCDDEERAAFEGDLQINLMKGMKYLWDHPEETGTIGLRFLQNLDREGAPRKEACGAGLFRNWGDLEKWSSRHPSHLAIYNGAIKHAKTFGPDRKFMTWHEVWIFKEGEANFEYVNCTPETGVIRWVHLERQNLKT